MKVQVATPLLPARLHELPVLIAPPIRGTCVSETTPVGVTAVPGERSVTVTVHKEGVFTGSVVGEQLSTVEVVLRLVTVCPSKGSDCR